MSLGKIAKCVRGLFISPFRFESHGKSLRGRCMALFRILSKYIWSFECVWSTFSRKYTSEEKQGYVFATDRSLVLFAKFDWAHSFTLLTKQKLQHFLACPRAEILPFLFFVNFFAAAFFVTAAREIWNRETRLAITIASTPFYVL